MPLAALLWAMRWLGLPEWLVGTVQAMYVHARSRVLINSRYSEEFIVQFGVHQGSVFSQGSHGSGKSQGKTIFLQGQGKVREFWFESGKIYFFVKSVKNQGILYQVFVVAYSSCWENSCFKKYPKCVSSADSTRAFGKTQTLWEVQLYTY